NNLTMLPLGVINHLFERRFAWDPYEDKVFIPQDDFESIATAFLYALDQRSDEAATYISDPLRQVLPPELVTEIWQVPSVYGHLKRLIQTDTERNSIHVNVHLVYEMESVPIPL